MYLVGNAFLKGALVTCSPIHYVSVSLCVCVSVCVWGGLLSEARRGQQIPCEPPDMREGNQPRALEQQTLLTTEQSLQALGKT